MPKFPTSLRQLRRLSSSTSTSTSTSRSLFSPSILLHNTITKSSSTQPSKSSFIPHFIPSRCFSVNSPDHEGFDIEEEIKSESEKLANYSFYDVPDALDGASDGNQWLDSLEDDWYDPLFAAVISGLDNYHDFTGLPWWVVIASSTLLLRLTLFPLLVLQLKKMAIIGELLPKLPPPLPPPNSGKSYVEQFLLFWKEKKAVKCPSSLWILASASVQVPCFFLLMGSIRRMSEDHHPGFDSGGMLWFQNLTEPPGGVLGPIFPILIAGLHFISIQMSFHESTAPQRTTRLSSVKKFYKHSLDTLTLPMFILAFWVPQGSLVYWFTNNVFMAAQVISLRHPAFRDKLGLSNVSSGNLRAVQNFSPDQLLSISLQLLADGHEDRAVSLLRLALEKDPEFVKGLVVLGQTLMKQSKLEEATEYLERGISKLTSNGHPTSDNEITLLVLAYSWAGLTCIHQGKTNEGLEHLKRIPQLPEPQDPKGKGHYYDGFVLLSSALVNVGKKDEAASYLRTAATFNPAFNEFIQQLKDEDNNAVSAKT